MTTDKDKSLVLHIMRCALCWEGGRLQPAIPPGHWDEQVRSLLPSRTQTVWKTPLWQGADVCQPNVTVFFRMQPASSTKLMTPTDTVSNRPSNQHLTLYYICYIFIVAHFINPTWCVTLMHTCIIIITYYVHCIYFFYTMNTGTFLVICTFHFIVLNLNFKLVTSLFI